MFVLGFGKTREEIAQAQSLYEKVLKKSRDASFYCVGSVPDTVDGRFEMLALHVVLLIRRLAQEKGTKGLNQALFDTMFEDMEAACREIGIGDLSVPRHVKRMMTGLQGRYLKYSKALDENDAIALEEAVRRNIYGTKSDISLYFVQIMARFIKEAAQSLAEQEADILRAGKIDFPAFAIESENERRRYA